MAALGEIRFIRQVPTPARQYCNRLRVEVHEEGQGGQDGEESGLVLDQGRPVFLGHHPHEGSKAELGAIGGQLNVAASKVGQEGDHPAHTVPSSYSLTGSSCSRGRLSAVLVPAAWEQETASETRGDRPEKRFL